MKLTSDFRRHLFFTIFVTPSTAAYRVMRPYFTDLAAPGMPTIDFADVKNAASASGNPARNGPPPQMWSPSRIGVTLRGGHAVQIGGMHGEHIRPP